MSGGSLDYLYLKLGERSRVEGEVWRLLAVIAHEIEWGLSNDTCVDCAYARTGPALTAFFRERCEDATTAIAIMRDRQQHQCLPDQNRG